VRKIKRGEINRLNLKEYNLDHKMENGYWFYYDEKKGLLIPFSPKLQKAIESTYLDPQKRKKGMEFKEDGLEVNFSKMILNNKKNNSSSKLLRCNTKAVWCFINKKDIYQAFDDQISQIIEEAFLKKLPTVDITLKEGEYVTEHLINFSTMKKTEKNKNTFSVSVKRIAPIIPASTQHPNLSIDEMDPQQIQELKKDNQKNYIAHVKDMLWTSQRNYKVKKKIF
jgi:hypothetical protein